MTPEEKAAKAEQSLREVISDGNRMLREFKEAFREYRELLPKLVHESIDGEVRKGLDNYEDTLKGAIKAAEDSVQKRFDAMMDLLLFQDNRSNRLEELTPIEKVIAQKAASVAVNRYRAINGLKEVILEKRD